MSRERLKQFKNKTLQAKGHNFELWDFDRHQAFPWDSTHTDSSWNGARLRLPGIDQNFAFICFEHGTRHFRDHRLISSLYLLALIRSRTIDDQHLETWILKRLILRSLHWRECEWATEILAASINGFTSGVIYSKEVIMRIDASEDFDNECSKWLRNPFVNRERELELLCGFWSCFLGRFLQLVALDCRLSPVTLLLLDSVSWRGYSHVEFFLRVAANCFRFCFHGSQHFLRPLQPQSFWELFMLTQHSTNWVWENELPWHRNLRFKVNSCFNGNAANSLSRCEPQSQEWKKNRTFANTRATDLKKRCKLRNVFARLWWTAL